MKVSLKTVQTLVDFQLPPVNELVERINAQLGKAEEVIDLGAKYKDALIVRVVECEKHANADKLSVTKIDDGNVRQNVERDENGYIQVVCGANNVHAEMWAVWLPPASVVPSTCDDAEPFVLGARELRGVMSNGMLASNKELAIGTDHDGIVELTERDIAEGKVLDVGADFAEVFDLDDTIIDIENKMFTHRPDLFGQLGVAREISAIIKGLSVVDEGDTRFVNPDWYWEHPEFVGAEGIELEVNNGAPEKVSRFMSVAMDNISVGPSPFWLQAKLVAMGGKPVNNVVDITNYIMLITAQPTHAYDYDKLRGGVLGTRMAKAGETITLLNNKDYTLDEDDIVIVDGEGLIGLAGIMGGFDSEVTHETKRIAIEVATFDMYTLRKSSMRHGLFTDALTRFNKGQSRMQNNRVLVKLIEMYINLAGAKQASDVFDLVSEHDYLGKPLAGEVEVAVGVDFINERLGTNFTADEISNLLRRANFAAVSSDHDDNKLMLAAPFWRTDIALPEDIVEEVGRLYGFDKLPRELPIRSMKAAPKNIRRDLKQKIRESLSRSGANEVLTYSFVHENIMNRSRQDSSQAFKIGNALSPDLQYYRLTVLPSLLDKVHMNIKAGHDEFTLFEIGKGHNKKYHADDEGGLPSEMQFVDVVYASKQPKAGASYYYVRQLIQQLSSDLGFEVILEAIAEPMDYPVTAPFDLERSALVTSSEGVFIGMIGELKQSVVKDFKLPQYTAAMTLDLEGLSTAAQAPRQTYMPLSKYPSINQDISVKVASTVAYAAILDSVQDAIDHLDEEIDTVIEPVSIYRSPEDVLVKTITLRLTFNSQTTTLSSKQVAVYMKSVEQSIMKHHKSETV